MSIVAIPGYNVQKLGKDKYAVSVNNGNMGAAVVNKEQLKTLADVYGVPVKEHSTAKKVVAGLAVAGTAAAAIVYRKNIRNFVKGLKDVKVGEFAQAAKTKMGDAAGVVKNKTVAGAETVKDAVAAGAGKVKEKAGKWYNKAAEWIVNVWKSVKTFFKGLFGKKTDAVQQELPFPKNEKAGEGFWSKVKNSSKKAWNYAKNLGGKNDLETERLWEYRLAKQQPVGIPKVERQVDLMQRYGVK